MSESVMSAPLCPPCPHATRRDFSILLSFLFPFLPFLALVSKTLDLCYSFTFATKKSRNVLLDNSAELAAKVRTAVYLLVTRIDTTSARWTTSILDVIPHIYPPFPLILLNPKSKVKTTTSSCDAPIFKARE